MSNADILVLIITILIMLAIVFFTFVLPLIKNKGKPRKCVYCPIAKDKKIKRAFKDYKKSNK